jgi:hypothetical protein
VPRWSNLHCEKSFFPHVVSSDVIAPREILLLEESWTKTHGLAPFLKSFYENDLEIKK